MSITPSDFGGMMSLINESKMVMLPGEDLLMDTIQAKRNVGKCYQKLYDAVYEFEEKWEKKGVNISGNVDWKSKTILWLVFHDRIPDEVADILEEFKDKFNVELTEIHEERRLKTSSRNFGYITWRYEFQHVDRWKELK